MNSHLFYKYNRGYLRILLMLICTLMITASCRNVSDNGELDGYWQIMTIETAQSLPVPEIPRKYIGIQSRVIQCVGTDNEPFATGNLAYDKSAQTISCDFPYYDKFLPLYPDYPDRDEGYRLRAFGIYAKQVKMQIKVLNNSRLVLFDPNSGTTISCRRF